MATMNTKVLFVLLALLTAACGREVIEVDGQQELSDIGEPCDPSVICGEDGEPVSSTDFPGGIRCALGATCFVDFSPIRVQTRQGCSEMHTVWIEYVASGCK